MSPSRRSNPPVVPAPSLRLLRALAIVVPLCLAGCAAPLYEWDAYDTKTFRAMKAPNTAEEFRVGLEAHLARMREQKKRPAPGLYAELGTIYLQRGDVDQALKNYKLEHDAWEESRPFMSALMTQLEKRRAEGSTDGQGGADAKRP